MGEKKKIHSCVFTTPVASFLSSEQQHIIRVNQRPLFQVHNSHENETEKGGEGEAFRDKLVSGQAIDIYWNISK